MEQYINEAYMTKRSTTPYVLTNVVLARYLNFIITRPQNCTLCSTLTFECIYALSHVGYCCTNVTRENFLSRSSFFH